MSIFLKTEEAFDRPLGVDCYESSDGAKTKRISRWFANVVFAILFIVAKICWRFKIVGKENIEKCQGKSGAIIITNHESYLDAVFFYLAPRPKQFVRIIARDNIFGGIGGNIIARCGAFPIARDSADRVALKRAVKMLKSGELVGIMPEGTRRNKGTAEMKLHSGFCLMAKMAGDVPIIPMAISGAGTIKVKGKLPSFHKVRVTFGEPLYLSDFSNFEKSRRMDACAWYSMRRVFSLRDGVSESSIDMKSLFPNNEDFSDCFDGQSKDN